MAGEKCPYKNGCKYYPTDESDDPHDCAHYYNGHGYRVDASGRHYLRVSSAKSMLDRSDPDLVSWILSVAREVYGATRAEQNGPAWPKRGDPKVGRGEHGGWAYWDTKVKEWLPKQFFDRRFQDAFFLCQNIGKFSAMAGTLIHWYLDTRLWALTDFDEHFDPGPPPPLPPAFEIEGKAIDGLAGMLIDYSETLPERKRQVDRFIELFNPTPVAREQRMFSPTMGITGAFDALMMVPSNAVNAYCQHVVSTTRHPWFDLDLRPGLSRPFDGEEVVLVDWKTSKQTRAETVVQLGLYYLMLAEAEGNMRQNIGMSLPVPVRLMTVRFFAPQALEVQSPANRAAWEVVDIPLELARGLAVEALEEARKLGAII